MDDLSDLLYEGEIKKDSRRDNKPKENTNSFLSLIKNNAVSINDQNPSPDKIDSIEKLQKSKNNYDKETINSLASSEEIYVPKITSFAPKRENDLSPMRESDREYSQKAFSPVPQQNTIETIPQQISKTIITNRKTGVNDIVDNNNLQYSNNANEIKKIKQTLQEDKLRYEQIINEERERSNSKAKEYQKEIEELKSKHKEEISSINKLHNDKDENLNKEISRLKAQYASDIEGEKNRLRSSYQIELESKAITHKRELDEQKRKCDIQIEEIKAQIKHQMELNTLTARFEYSQKQIEDLAFKLQQDKDKISQLDKNAFQSKERYLKEYEEKLKEMDQNISKERVNIERERHEMEVSYLQKKKDNQEDKTRMEKELLRLQQLQNSFKAIEYQSKEINDKEAIALAYKGNELKLRIESFESTYKIKMSDIDYQRKTLEQEKKFFEQHKEDAFKAIEVKRINLEQHKKAIYEDEKNIKDKIKVLQEKELYLTEHVDEFHKVKDDVLNKEARLKEDENRIAMSATRLNGSIEVFEEQKRELEKEKENIARIYQALESQRIQLESQRMSIDQEKTDVKLRIQAVDNLRIKYVSTNANLAMSAFDVMNDNFSKTMPSSFGVNFASPVMNEQKPMNNQCLTQSNSNLSINNNHGRRDDEKMNKPLMNAEEYFQNLKLKLENKKYTPEHNNAFNSYLIKEKEYLRKSNEDLVSNMKGTYDLMSKNYENAMEREIKP